MSSNSKPDKPDVVAYGDHEVITPDTASCARCCARRLPASRTRSRAPSAALAQISSEFETWMNEECERLDAARRKVKEQRAVPGNQAGAVSGRP